MSQNIQRHFEHRREEAEGDSNLESQVRQEIANHRCALMEANRYGAGLSEEILKVAELAGDQIANTLGGIITVDKVGLKDYEELLYIYMHEGLHNKGFANEGLVQLIIGKYGPETAKAKAGEDYAEEQAAVEEVTRRIGTDKTIDLYENKEFTQMLTLFKYVCVEEENMGEEDAVKLFFRAFPELKLKETIH